MTHYRTQLSERTLIGYERDGNTSVKRYTLGPARAEEFRDVSYRASASARGHRGMVETSVKKDSRRQADERRRRAALEADPPKSRGDLVFVLIESAIVTARCTAQWCADNPSTVTMRLVEWVAHGEKCKRCRVCTSQMRLAIDRAVKARTRGNRVEA